jgi:acyl dehydratase
MKVSDPLPLIEKQIDMVDLVAYGAATWDWHPLHYDSARSSKVGGGAPIVDGQMFGALLANQVIGWLGPNAFITNMSIKYKSMVVAGDRVSIEGTVTKMDGDVIEVSQVVRNGDRVAVEATTRVRI